MLEEIKEYNKFVLVTGFRNVRIKDVDKFIKKVSETAKSCVIQVFNADNISGSRHLFFATLNALRAISQKRNISDRLEMEALLYASGQRQIKKAIEMLGVKLNTSKVAVLLIGNNKKTVQSIEKKLPNIMNGIKDNKVLEIISPKKAERLKQLYDISNLEIEALSNEDQKLSQIITEIIIEQGALLILEA